MKRTVRLQRHLVPLVTTTWLVAKRNKLNRDLRRLLCTLVARNLYDWETQALVAERVYQRLKSAASRLDAYYVRDIENKVEIWEHNAPPEDYDLRLRKVRLRPPHYRHWYWLH